MKTVIYNTTSKFLKYGNYIKFYIINHDITEAIKSKQLNRDCPTLLRIPQLNLQPDLQPYLEQIHKYCCLISNRIFIGHNIEIQFNEYRIDYNKQTRKYETSHYDAIIAFDDTTNLVTSIELRYNQLKQITLDFG